MHTRPSERVVLYDAALPWRNQCTGRPTGPLPEERIDDGRHSTAGHAG
jgi:hypothetical protein